ncbi:NAD(P)-binding protein [Daedalea quercina L-15889]|uniref:NAD(P)-binding protein n=1 Tax=Daedalea quercina L-15889 TaxID=1314783 RepID=A0A165T8K6_9APHY|nr:NAD(P)-binding protein [Daedalea quercina L-15889]
MLPFPRTSISQLSTGSVLAVALSILFVSRRLWRRSPRTKKISRKGERVVILGASSGIGRALAHQYARRGARVCVTARREDELKRVVSECEELEVNTGAVSQGASVCSVVADFTNVDEMVHLRDVLQHEWNGVDTLIVCAGVSALRPLMEVAGLEREGRSFTPPQASAEGIKHTVDIANRAIAVNYFGPLVSAVTLLPLLQNSSASPSILLISSLAALVPAPTRSLYCSTKAASLLLYQSLSIEHPAVTFTFAIPATVHGDFRASAVDGGPVREVDPNTHGVKPEDVARRCVGAVDAGEKFVFIPYVYSRLGHLLYWLFPGFVERQAGKKYNFKV